MGRARLGAVDGPQQHDDVERNGRGDPTEHTDARLGASYPSVRVGHRQRPCVVGWRPMRPHLTPGQTYFVAGPVVPADDAPISHCQDRQAGCTMRGRGGARPIRRVSPRIEWTREACIRRVALVALAVFFVVAGLNHVLNPAFYLRIMPPYLPWHRALVFVSGVLEVVGGVALLIPRWRRAAGLGLALLLVAVFPANLHMAMNVELFPAIAPGVLYGRLPLQAVFIAWALWATRGVE